MFHLLSPAVCLGFAFANPTSLADDANAKKEPINEKAIVKRSNVEADIRDDAADKLKSKVISDIAVTILAERGEKCLIWADGVECWVSRDDILPVTEAIKFFSETLRAEPKNVDAYLRRAAALYEDNKLEKAILDTQQAVRLEPKNVLALEARAFFSAKRERYTDAIADLDAAIAIDSKNSRAYINRGIAHYLQTNHDKAIADFSAAIELDMKNSLAYAHRGVSLAYAHRGVLYQAATEYDKALQDYASAIKADPTYWHAYQARAWLTATCPKPSFRDGQQAVKDATRSCELTKWENPICLATLASAYAEVGKFDDAVAWQKKALKNEEYSTSKVYGTPARERLKLYEMSKPYRDDKKESK